MLCSVTDCTGIVRARSLCRAHYIKNLRYGNTDGKTTKDGKTKRRAYGSWKSMMIRCLNPGHEGYTRYSTLGVDPRWLKFSNFFEDMGERPEGLTLERINNKEGYSKDNCRWATWEEQIANKHRSNQYIKAREVSYGPAS